MSLQIPSPQPQLGLGKTVHQVDGHFFFKELVQGRHLFHLARTKSKSARCCCCCCCFSQFSGMSSTGALRFVRSVEKEEEEEDVLMKEAAEVRSLARVISAVTPHPLPSPLGCEEEGGDSAVGAG